MSYVLITGASAGIGQAFAEVFAQAGHPIILVARNQERLTEAADQIKSNYLVDTKTISIDLSDPGAATKLYHKVANFKLEVSTLINNAAAFETGLLADASPDTIERLLTLNISSLTLLTRLFLNDMLERNQGQILNVASVAAFQAMPGMACYAASKAFVLSLTEALSEEFKNSGVSITALCPGFTNTEMASKTVEALESNLGNLPELFLANPRDVAKAGYDACMKGEALKVPGMANKLFSAWSQTQPKWLWRKLSGSAFRWLQD